MCASADVCSQSCEAIAQRISLPHGWASSGLLLLQVCAESTQPDTDYGSPSFFYQTGELEVQDAESFAQRLGCMRGFDSHLADRRLVFTSFL